MQEAIVLANASAGREHGWLSRLECLCLVARVALVKTASPREARRVAGGAARAGCARVIAAGGDGTAHHVLNALAGTETALGIIPLGTANDFARALGLPLEADAAFRLAISGPTRRIDLGRIRFAPEATHAVAPASRRYLAAVSPVGMTGETPARQRLFGSVATFGLGADANRLANRLAFGGGFKYSYALLRALLRHKPPKVTVRTDAQEFEEPMTVGLVGNTSSYGGGMKVTPHAVMDDALLDVCLVGRMSRLKLIACFPQVFSGTHLKHPEVSYFRAARVRVGTDPPIDVFADGEFIARTPVEFEIVPSCLNVIGG